MVLLLLPSCRDEQEEAFLSYHFGNEELTSTVSVPAQAVQMDSIIAELNGFYTPDQWYIYIFQTSKLTQAEKEMVLRCIEKYTDGKYEIWYFPVFRVLRTIKIASIYVNSQSSVPAGYNPSTNTIMFKTITDMAENRVIEELLHAGQNRIYPGGIEQYLFKGLPNIEFEVRFFRDLVDCVNGDYFGAAESPYNELYGAWVYELCDGEGSRSVFPSMERVLEVKMDGRGYYDMVKGFKKYYPSYAAPIDPSLRPLLVNYIYNSTLKSQTTEEQVSLK